MKNIILYDFFKKNKFTYIVGVVFMFLASYIQTLFPKVLGNTIDLMKVNGFNKNQVLINVFYIFLIAIATFIFTFLWRNLVIANARNLECYLRERLYQHFQKLSPEFYSQRKTGDLIAYAINDISAVRMTFGPAIVKDLRGRVFRTIQYLPLSYLDKTSSGRLITRATNDIAEISDLYTDVIMNLLKSVFLLIGIIYAMVALNPELALISFAVIPIMAFLVVMIKNKIKENFFNMKHLIGRINGFMAESISGMKIIQIFRAEKEKNAEFLKLNQEYFKTTLIQVRLNSVLKPASDLFQSLAIAILIWYGMGKITHHTLQLGLLYAFTTYIRQFFDPISDVADKYNNIQSALVSTERIFALLQQQDIQEDLETGNSREHLEGVIEFKNVWFSYNNRDWVLKNVSFKAAKGQIIAFVGETGAGKTTIISLVNGFYKIQKGEILIDGININNIKLKDLRKNIAVVLQDVFLFSGNIKDNITLNDPIPEEQVKNALQLSYATTFVDNFPQGIYEPVLERGNTLSSGERQLLSFARALAHNPSIFVLDEATANIDTHTEKLIQKAIENIAKDRTTLIIAHRLSTIRNAAKIIVMKNGEIVELGNHHELMQLGGHYQKMLEEGDSDLTVPAFGHG
jgi:ATP-binding cassette, subfamily B, multidrug efflux pump